MVELKGSQKWKLFQSCRRKERHKAGKTRCYNANFYHFKGQKFCFAVVVKKIVNWDTNKRNTPFVSFSFVVAVAVAVGKNGQASDIIACVLPSNFRRRWLLYFIPVTVYVGKWIGKNMTGQAFLKAKLNWESATPFDVKLVDSIAVVKYI